MKLGPFIKARRSHLGLSMDGLKGLTGVAKPTIADLEHERTVNLQVDTLVRLAKGLKVKPALMLEAAIESLREGD